MKLTIAQLTIVWTSLNEYVLLTQGRADRAPLGDDKDFWTREAEETRKLHLLMKDAINVEVESVELEPAKDACGDINCDGQCAPQQAPRPMLINRVDLCTSAEDARREESLATPAQRRMAARFLRVDLHDLPGALVKRTSERLTAATPPQRQPLAPALLNAIDECATSNAARDLLRNAQPADRRAVAKFLNIPANDLLDVITHRMSTRMQQAA